MRWFLLPICLFLGLTSPASAYLLTHDFSRDPGWEGHNNRLVAASCPTVTQEFGFASSREAGGLAAGEVGGRLWRSLTPAWYGKGIGGKTLADQLTAEGTLKVTDTASSSGALLGWFNQSSRDWRMSNSMVMRLDDVNGDKTRVRAYLEYGTRNWRTQSQVLERNGSTYDLEVGRSYPWRLSYDPSGEGVATLAVGGQSISLSLRAEDRADGASFDRFGLANVQVPGGPMALYVDDVKIGADNHAFGSDPLWDGHGNRLAFPDCRQQDVNDFGYTAGRAGGLLWRSDPDSSTSPAWYGDPLRGLSMEEPLHALGTVDLSQASSDSASYIGWFNSQGRGELPTDFLGILIEGPSRVGQYFRPAYRPHSETSRGAVAPDGPILNPTARPVSWALDYEPLPGGGGMILGQVDGQSFSLPVSSSDRRSGAQFNRFGIRGMERGGHSQTVYLDDLTYTAGPGLLPPVAEPAAPAAAPASSGGPRLRISRRALVVSRRGVAALRVACLSDDPCRGAARLETAEGRSSTFRGARQLRLGSRPFQASDSRSLVVPIRLGRRGRQLLRRRGRLRARATVVAVDSRGRAKAARAALTLLAPRR